MDYAVARKHMVDSQVRPNDVTNLDLQLAMEEIPREQFVPGSQQPMAYAEMDIELFPGRYLLQARDFSKLIHSAGIEKDDLVLDVGCGFGYSSAILSRIAGMVMAIEETDEVVEQAEAKLTRLNADNLVVMKSALHEGLAKQGPYDAIVLAGGAVEFIPEALTEQLKENGRLVCIEQTTGPGKAMVYTKADSRISALAIFEAMPAGYIPEFVREKAFTF